MKKSLHILLNALPVLVMIGLIPLVSDDYLLTALYTGIIIASLAFKRYPHDLLVLAFGFCIMIVSEYLFIKTGVETFNRTTLFGLMPLWLPFLFGLATVQYLTACIKPKKVACLINCPDFGWKSLKVRQVISIALLTFYGFHHEI